VYINRAYFLKNHNSEKLDQFNVLFRIEANKNFRENVYHYLAYEFNEQINVPTENLLGGKLWG